MKNLSRAKFATAVSYKAHAASYAQLTGFARGSKAAKSLATQRSLAARARRLLPTDLDLARDLLRQWKEERARYLVLVNFY